MIFRIFETRPAPIPVGSKRSFANLRDKSFLLGVGAQKAGTTWLSSYLTMHPQVAISPIKELHVWDQYVPSTFGYDAPRRAVKRFQSLYAKHVSPFSANAGNIPAPGENNETTSGWGQNSARQEALKDRIRMISDPWIYLEHFDRIIDPGSRVCAEITPEYALLPANLLVQVREFVLPHFRNVKPVFIMRDPVDRLWSNLKHDHRRGRAGPASETWRKRMTSREVVDRTRYDLTCASLEEAFPKDHILYLFFESLFFEDTLMKLCDFMNVDYHAVDREFLTNEVKKGLADSMPAEFVDAAREMLNPVYEFARQHFADRVPASWRW